MLVGCGGTGFILLNDGLSSLGSYFLVFGVVGLVSIIDDWVFGQQILTFFYSRSRSFYNKLTLKD